MTTIEVRDVCTCSDLCLFVHNVSLFVPQMSTGDKWMQIITISILDPDAMTCACASIFIVL